MSTANFLTFDIEEWYHANYKSVYPSLYSNPTSNFEKNVDTLRKMCDMHKVKATCFVVGEVAKQYPHVVKRLAKDGHEIAAHSYKHRLIYEMKPKEFYKDALLAKKTLEHIIGKKIHGYRAPSWSVQKSQLGWFYESLADAGYEYSSSVFPVKNYLYGIPDFPQHIHKPVVGGKEMPVVEVPVSVFRLLGMNMGYSGGVYFRFFPYFVIKYIMKKRKKENKPVVVYLHPREIDPDTERLKLSLFESFIHYWGVSSCQRKLEEAMGDFSRSYKTMYHEVRKYI